VRGYYVNSAKLEDDIELMGPSLGLTDQGLLSNA
jgi:hypothetical protein